MDQRKRNTILLIVLAGLYFVLGEWVGFFTLAAVFMIVMAIYLIRKGDEKLGYILLAVGVLILASKILAFFAIVILLVLGLYYMKVKHARNAGNMMQKFSIVESWQQQIDPWILTDMKRWSVVSEVNLDMSLAILEQPETTIELEGVIGDIDIVVPEEIGLLVDASIHLGDIKIGAMHDEGFMNTLLWQSPHYEQCETKVRLSISYYIGDIDIKMV